MKYGMKVININGWLTTHLKKYIGLITAIIQVCLKKNKSPHRRTLYFPKIEITKQKTEKKRGIK
jgi:hypothetical protein